MPERTRAKDASSLHKYRIELPVLIDDMELSVYARSLYIHLKRVAGDHGSCWESARTLAKACGMSAGQVSKAKDELAARGLITRGIKSVRGGIGDDITIVDIWPETFKRYAPESEQPKESDHHTITSPSKRSPHDRLEESDHHTITLPESDHTVNTLTSKRSPHDPKNMDLPYREDHDHVGGVGVGRTLAFLIDEGMSAAEEFADLPYEPMRADYDARMTAGQTKAQIVKAWRLKPPTQGQPYERPNGRQDAPHQPTRPTARGKHGPTGGSDIHEPGWRERLIADAERRAAENGITE